MAAVAVSCSETTVPDYLEEYGDSTWAARIVAWQRDE